MGYQALLFCPDEKLARVVTQVFGDLDFVVEPVHEPFAAVKKLMAQRFDAIVVDCENEQNASLLFKSARNSSSNQSSLAIALVLGQAGVAKAYRIGANLVLTKPINIEQAKGTLRVARGLLRKNSDAATGTTPAAEVAATTPVSSNSSSQSPSRIPVGTAADRLAGPEFDAPAPMAPLSFAAVHTAALPADPSTMTGSAQAEPATAPRSVPSIQSDLAVKATDPSSLSLDLDQDENDAILMENTVEEAAKHDTSQTAVPPVVTALVPAATAGSSSHAASYITSPVASVPVASAPVASGSAAAPAPAREALASPAKPSSTIELEPAKSMSESASAYSSASMSSGAPTFGILNEEPSEGSGAQKKVLIAAAAVLVLAALGYFGYGKISHSASPQPAPHSLSSPQSAGQPASESVASPEPSLSNSSQPGSSSSQAPASKTTTVALPEKPGAGTPPVIRIAANPEPETKKPEPAPMIVKAGTPSPKVQASTDEAAPSLPSSADAASGTDNNLTSLMPSAANVAKPSLAILKVSQGVSTGLVIKRVQPTYPAAALAAHAQGAVQIEATVTKEGNVTNLKVLSGDPILSRAALDAVRQWRYKPYYLDGQPVEIQTQITVNFKAN